jgi:hypothetical protein
MIKAGDRVRIVSADPEDAGWLIQHIGEVYTVENVTVYNGGGALKGSYARLSGFPDALPDDVYLHDLQLVDPPKPSRMRYRVPYKSSPLFSLGEFPLREDAELFLKALQAAYPVYKDTVVETITEEKA